MQETLLIPNQELRKLDGRILSKGFLKIRREQIERKLHTLGAVQYDMLLPESKILPLVMQPNETLLGIVYGRYHFDTMTGPVIGRGLLIATDSRILLVDRKPLYLKCNEIAYQVVSGVSFTQVSIAGTVVLNTRLGNIAVRTFNQTCARQFVTAIESKIFLEEIPDLELASLA